MNFTILGRTALRIAGAEVNLGAAKQRALLALLLLQVERAVPVDLMVEVLWPGRTRKEVANNLHSLVSRMRGALGRSGVEYRLVGGGDAYRLDVNRDLIDYHLFLRLVRQARALSAADDHVAAKRLLEQAIGLWDGVPLADIRGEWAAKKRAQLEDGGLRHAQKSLLEVEIELGEYAEVLQRIGPLMELRPFDDTLAKLLMTALAGSGDRAGAVAFYADYRRRLATELGTEPSIELGRLHLRLLHGEPAVRPTAKVVVSPVESTYTFPRAAGGFTGRVELLAQLDALLAGARGSTSPIVALHGMPGVGKTQLAIHWAHRHRADFPDGMVLLDMRGYDRDEPVPPDNAISILLDRLGVPPDQIPLEPSRRPAALGRALAGRRPLLVIDNVRDSDQVRSLLSATADCFVLLTSRDRLRNLAVRVGVHTLAVPELNTAECEALLCSIVKDGRPNRDEEGLLELSRLSGGLPLALNLIARHVADRPRETLSGLADQLKAQRDLFVLRDDDETANLPAVFSWSYLALASETARVFRLLGLHPGARVSAEATAALAGIPVEAAVKHLDALVRVNLLDYDVAGRYRFHDLLHQYAGDCVRHADPPGVRRDAIERMLTWYVLTASVASMQLSPQSDPVPSLPAVPEVFPLSFTTDQAALEWCAHERQNLVAATRVAATNLFHDHAWRLPAAVQEVFERSGYHDDLITSHELAVDSARATGTAEAQIGTLNNLGLMYLNVDRLDDAYRRYHEGLDLARKVGHLRGEAACLHNLGTVHFKRGDHHTALWHYQQALAINHELQANEGLAFGYHRIGLAHQRLGNLGQAKANYVEALRIRLEIGHVRGQGTTLTALAQLHHDLGEPDIALAYCEQALNTHRLTGDRVEGCRALAILAAVDLDLGDLVGAGERAAEAIAIAEDINEVVVQVCALHTLGRVLMASGDRRAAIEQCEKALVLLATVDDPAAEDLRGRVEGSLRSLQG